MKLDNWIELILLKVKIKTLRLLLFINFWYSWLVLCCFLNFYQALHKRWHCVKRACIRSYSGPESIRSYFPAFELNIQSKCRKIRTKINPNMETFYTVWSFPLKIYLVNVNKSAGNCALFHIYQKKYLMENFILCTVKYFWRYSIFVHVNFKHWFAYLALTSPTIMTGEYNPS